MILHGSEKNHLSERHHLAEDEPDVNHLDVRGGGQALHLADEDGSHHQHGGQVHAQGCLKEEVFLVLCFLTITFFSQGWGGKHYLVKTKDKGKYEPGPEAGHDYNDYVEDE